MRGLERLFEDSTQPLGQREEAFFGYWLTRMGEHGALTRADWVQILQWPELLYAINNLLHRTVLQGHLTVEDARWLLDTVSEKSQFGRDQVEAWLTIVVGKQPWQDMLQRVLALRADWAATLLLEELPSSERDEARDIIRGSARPRRARNRLLQLLDAADRAEKKAPQKSPS